MEDTHCTLPPHEQLEVSGCLSAGSFRVFGIVVHSTPRGRVADYVPLRELADAHMRRRNTAREESPEDFAARELAKFARDEEDEWMRLRCLSGSFEVDTDVSVKVSDSAVTKVEGSLMIPGKAA